jgi:hypothetical protein
MPATAGAFMLGAREALGDPETLPVPAEEEKPSFIGFVVLLLPDGEAVIATPEDLHKYNLIPATPAQVATACHAVGQNVLIGTLTNSVISAQQAMVRQAVEQQQAAALRHQLGDLNDPNVPIVGGRPRR